MQSKNCEISETEINRLRSYIEQGINDKANFNYLTRLKFPIDKDPFTLNSLALATVGNCCSEIDLQRLQGTFSSFLRLTSKKSSDFIHHILSDCMGLVPFSVSLRHALYTLLFGTVPLPGTFIDGKYP